jgi:peptide deformylase
MSSELEFDLTLYPSPTLRRPAEAVESFDEELQAICAAMLRCMYRSKGVGLSGPQVGLRKRILVLNPTGEPQDELALVNPELLERSGPLTLFEEGCLSFPEIFAEVERHEVCRLKAFTPKGEEIEKTFDGFPGRIIQHEYDHLVGVLLVDRMSPADKLRHKASLEDLVARYKRTRKSAEKAER